VAVMMVMMVVVLTKAQVVCAEKGRLLSY